MQSFDRLMQTRIEQHNSEREARVAHNRLVREATAGQRFVRVVSYKPVLVRVGRRMVIWGTQLQRRYADPHYGAELELNFQND